MNFSRYLAFTEQALISGSNFLLYLFAARNLPKESWGELSLALGFILVIQGFQRAFVTIPMVTTDSGLSEFNLSIGFWKRVQLSVSLGLLLFVLVGYVLSVLFYEPWIQRTLLYSMLLLIPLFYLEFARRIIVMSSGAKRLVGMAVAYVLGLLLIVGGGSAYGYAGNVWVFVSALAVASLASLYVAGVPLFASSRTDSDSPWCAASLWQFGRWAAASSLAYTGYNFAIQGLLAAMSGPVAVGVFAAARNLIQPINTLIQAVDTVDKPRAGRAFAATGIDGLRSVTRRSWKAMLVVGLPYLCLVYVFSDSILNLFYGEKYADGGSAVRLWCFVALAMIFAQPLETCLYVIKHPDWLFYTRISSAMLVIIVCPWLILNWSFNGALLALSSGWMLAGIFAMWRMSKYCPVQGRQK